MTAAPRITWLGRSPDTVEAWVGGLPLGYVLTRNDGSVVYSVGAVSTRYVTKGGGEVSTVEQGKASVRRAWVAWWSQMAGKPGWGA